jgi:predicted alpha/beta-hydrolase family hydrolase
VLLEPSARYEEVKIPLAEPVGDLHEVTGVLGIPEWWPTGSRVAVVLAHGTSGGMGDPLIEHLQTELTERKFMTLRFNFPFWESHKAGKRTTPDSLPVLAKAFRAAIASLGRDPVAAPAYLFLGGKGLGARVTAELARSQVRLDGVFFMGLPLHSQDKPENIQAEYLYRIVSPMLFLQGTRDRRCELEALRRCLARVGAPHSLHIAEGADQNFKVLKKADRTDAEVRAAMVSVIGSWIEKRLNES